MVRSRSLLQERIGPPFDADLCGRAVPRQDGHFIVQRPQFFPNATQEQFVIATWQIRPADAAGEENVAAKEHLALPLQETHAAGAMAGDVQNLEINAFYDQRRRFRSQKVGLDGLDLPIKAELLEITR